MSQYLEMHLSLFCSMVTSSHKSHALKVSTCHYHLHISYSSIFRLTLRIIGCKFQNVWYVRVPTRHLCLFRMLFQAFFLHGNFILRFIPAKTFCSRGNHNVRIDPVFKPFVTPVRQQYARTDVNDACVITVETTVLELFLYVVPK